MERRTKTKGFSLVELLVVVTVIGLLVALLVPQLSAIRSLARQTRCAHNLKQLHSGFQGAVGKSAGMGISSFVSQTPYPEPIRWPMIPSNVLPARGVYLCDEDKGGDWLAVPLVYRSAPGFSYNGQPIDIPFSDGFVGPYGYVLCCSRRGVDARGPYTEFVCEENASYPYGCDFTDRRPWYPAGPDYSDNDGVWRVYDPDASGNRIVELVYYTCTVGNEIWLNGERLSNNLYDLLHKPFSVNMPYTSYGINNNLKGKYDAKPGTIVLMDYDDRIIDPSPAATTTLSSHLDSPKVARHRGKVNVLYADGAVRTIGATSLYPAVTNDWQP